MNGVTRRRITRDPDMEADEVSARQLALAQRIGAEFLDCADMKPLGRHSSFNHSAPASWHFWHNEPVDKLIWWAVAQRIMQDTVGSRFFDHAWLFGHADTSFEPWGFVCETYMDKQAAVKAAPRIERSLRNWGVKIHVMASEDSSWNPGSCLPIVVTGNHDCSFNVGNMMHKAAAWALKTIGGRVI